jgi:membrane protein
MADMENARHRRADLDGWSLAAALGLLAVVFLWDRLAPPKNEAFPSEHEANRDASLVGIATEREDRGREPMSPSEIPAKGWKDILLRVYANIGEHPIFALAAGMTYYSILAIFPALVALVAIYGVFSDPGSIAKHLDQATGFMPSGAIDVARDQLTRVASKGSQALGLTFAVSLAVSLWSANAAMKSLFDTLNIVYREHEKRGFVKLNAVSLGFTLAAIGFALLALGAVVAIRWSCSTSRSRMPQISSFVPDDGPPCLSFSHSGSRASIASGRAARRRGGDGSLGGVLPPRFSG